MSRHPSALSLGSSARAVAYQTLVDWQPHREFATDRLDELLAGAANRERPLARELTLGTVRRLATLDALIMPHVSRPRERVEDGLWTLMRLGAYQLAFLSGMAEHAAVHETVALAKRIEPRWSGFLNAILRKVAASLTDTILNAPSADSVPLADGRYRQLRTRLFPDPEEQPAGYFAAAFSFPDWLVARWAERFEPRELFSLGMFLNRPPLITLRVNQMRATRDDLLERLENAGISAESGDHPAAIRLRENRPVPELPGFAEGHFTVQDETAMWAATTLAPQPDERVLDLCATPGTKTTHLAELMGNRGLIVAADIHSGRLARVRENAERLGASIIDSQLIDEAAPQWRGKPFDAALVDAPCSNTGVLAKRPEARWRLRPEDLRELPAAQVKLLDFALDHVTPSGRVLYSTCSIEPEENEQVVQSALRGRSDLRLLNSRLFLPGEPADGGFQAVIGRERE